MIRVFRRTGFEIDHQTCRLIVIFRAIGAEACLPGRAAERMRGQGYG